MTLFGEDSDMALVQCDDTLSKGHSYAMTLSGTTKRRDRLS